MNFSRASVYGDVVFLTDKEYRPHPCPEGVNDALTSQIRERMKDYLPGIDYIITTGSAIPNIIVGMILAERGERNHKILKWSNRMEDYEMFHLKYPLTITRITENAR